MKAKFFYFFRHIKTYKQTQIHVKKNDKLNENLQQ